MNSNIDLTMTSLKMIVSLIIVLGIVMALYYLIKRLNQNTITSDKNEAIKIISNKYLGLKKNLCLVEIPGAILLLGLTSDKITCLTKIEAKNIINQIRSENKKESFVSHMNKISAKIIK